MKKKLFFLLPVFFIFLQCKKDDDTPQYVIREYSDQVLVDQSILEEYYFKMMSTQYHNLDNDNNKLFSFLTDLNDEQIYYLINGGQLITDHPQKKHFLCQS